MNRNGVDVTRVSVVLDVTVPRGMEDRALDLIWREAREVREEGREALYHRAEYSSGEPMFVPDFIWKEYDRALEASNALDIEAWREEVALLLRTMYGGDWNEADRFAALSNEEAQAHRDENPLPSAAAEKIIHG